MKEEFDALLITDPIIVFDSLISRRLSFFNPVSSMKRKLPPSADTGDSLSFVVLSFWIVRKLPSLVTDLTLWGLSFLLEILLDIFDGPGICPSSIARYFLAES